MQSLQREPRLFISESIAVPLVSLHMVIEKGTHGISSFHLGVCRLARRNMYRQPKAEMNVLQIIISNVPFGSTTSYLRYSFHDTRHRLVKGVPNC